MNLLASCILAMNMTLNHLVYQDKHSTLQTLENATDAQLWDALLEGQAKLLFDSEYSWIANENWWPASKRVLEIGSGNGAFLLTLAGHAPEKSYLGIEKLPKSLEKALESNKRTNVVFREGDAEVFDERLVDSADVVIFRLVLQHLSDPVLALQNAAKYSNDYVLIIDAYDKARRTSHPITAMDEAVDLVEQKQRVQNSTGNRRISLDLLETLQNKTSPLSDLYEVIFTNLDADGNLLKEMTRFEGKRARELFSNHVLLFLTLVNRTYHVPVNLDKAFDELQDYLKDEEAWSSVGMHYLVLRKKYTQV